MGAPIKPQQYHRVGPVSHTTERVNYTYASVVVYGAHEILLTSTDVKDQSAHWLLPGKGMVLLTSSCLDALVVQLSLLYEGNHMLSWFLTTTIMRMSHRSSHYSLRLWDRDLDKKSNPYGAEGIVGLSLLKRHSLASTGLSITNLRRSDDRLRFIMGIPIPVRRYLHSEQMRWETERYVYNFHHISALRQSWELQALLEAHHNNNVIMSAMAFQITSLTIV